MLGQGTLVDVLVSNPDFSTLVVAVTAADLVGVLSGGNFYHILLSRVVKVENFNVETPSPLKPVNIKLQFVFRP